MVENPICLFCKGPHSSTDRSCPEWDNQRKIKETMACRNISYTDAKKFLFPEAKKILKFSKVLHSDYNKSFPELPHKGIQLRESVSIPVKPNLSRKNNYSGDIRQNLATGNSLSPTKGKRQAPAYARPYKQYPDINNSKQSSASKPEYTHSYYNGLQEKELIPSKPVYIGKGISDESNTTQPSFIQHKNYDQSSSNLMHYLSMYKQNKLTIEHLMDKLRPLITENYSTIFNYNEEELSDASL